MIARQTSQCSAARFVDNNEAFSRRVISDRTTVFEIFKDNIIQVKAERFQTKSY